MNSSRYTDVPTVRGRPQGIGGVMTRRRVTAFVAALAITFVVPSSDVWARKPAHSAPVVTVLNDTALGLEDHRADGDGAATSSSTGAGSSSKRR